MTDGKPKLVVKPSSCIGVGDYVSYEGVNYHQTAFGSLVFDVYLSELTEIFFQEKSYGDQWEGPIGPVLENSLMIRNQNQDHFRPIGKPQRGKYAHGEAELSASRAGLRPTLSLFGSDNIFSKVDIYIRETHSVEYAELHGFPEFEGSDYDDPTPEEFCLDLFLGSERYDALVNNISNNDNSKIQVTIDLTYLPSLFGEEEMHDDIGRNYKYLESQDDLTMMETPSNRIKRAGLTNPAPFKLTVTRQIGFMLAR